MKNQPFIYYPATLGKELKNWLTPSARFAGGFFTAEPALVIRSRQRAHLLEAAYALREFESEAHDGREELMAEHLRLAARALGKLLGRVDVEDILDVIFRDFCIGK